MPNAGQWNKQTAFVAQTFAGTFFVTSDGKLVYHLPGRAQHDVSAKDPDATRGGDVRSPLSKPNSGWLLRETFIRSDQRPVTTRPRGQVPAAGRVSILVGQPERHVSALATFEQVSLGEVYPGIEVQLRAFGGTVEKIFSVKPRRDPKQIRVRLEGTKKLTVSSTGELIVDTGNGPAIFSAPLAYQEASDGTRRNIKVRYALADAGNSYGFEIGKYNPRQTLIIDPLLQATYLGSFGMDAVRAIAIHPTNGQIYVAGDTSADFINGVNFPGVSGGAQPTFQSAGDTTDIFIARFSANLTVLLQSTYLGDIHSDHAVALAIHPTSGEVYLAGYSNSPNFPFVARGAQPILAERRTGIRGDGYDAVVSRLNPNLTAILQSTYLGGTGSDSATSLAIHPASGDVYVAGESASTDFPGTTGGALPDNAYGEHDGFVSRLNTGLTALLQSTYLGGTGDDRARALAISPSRSEIYVAGDTNSTDFPAVAGAPKSLNTSGSSDGFVSRVNLALTSLLQSTYVGGPGESIDGVTALAIRPVTSEIYVAGGTNSPNFPAAAGGAQATHIGSDFDGFVSRLSPTLTSLIQSTYLGASGANDFIRSAVVHPTTGSVYLTGITYASAFPGVTGGAQSNPAGSLEAFISAMNPNLTALTQSTYLGITTVDTANALAIHPTSGEVYVAGSTDGTNFPRTAGGARSTFSGHSDGFVSRLSADLSASSGFVLSVTKAGTGTGNVSSTPAGISCGTDCTELYAVGITVALTATPATGSTFAGWSGACTSTGACSVTMAAARNVTATFNASTATFSLTVNRIGTGTGSVVSTPAGISCGADCAETYANGSTISLTATPATGSVFAGWSGACTGTGVCSLTMNAVKTVTATFNTTSTTLPTVVLSASWDLIATEAGATSGAFLVRRLNSTNTTALTVFYSLGGSAVAGTDYVALSGSVIIPAGTSSALVAITALDDTIAEADETATATLVSNPAYAVGVPTSAVVTIQDNDSIVSVSATDATATETGATTGEFRVTRSGNTTAPLTVFYSLYGTAVGGSDYVALPASVTILAGATSAVTRVTPIDDALVEGVESVTLVLANNSAYTRGTPDRATVNIVSNE